jgi:hypothetical protein
VSGAKPGFRIQDSAFQIPEAEEQVSGAGFRGLNQDSGFRIPDSGFRRPKGRVQVSGAGFRVPGAKPELGIQGRV